MLSGNRNFEGRINPHVKANYLASPPLVVAYALAGTTDIDLATRAAGRRQRRQAGVPQGHLADARGSAGASSTRACCRRCSSTQYDNVWQKNEKWNAIEVTGGELYEWDDDEHLHPGAAVLGRSHAGAGGRSSRSVGARCLAALGDSVTTDHISPAGSIAKASPAGKYLMEHGVEPVDFNSYGARRGNDRVMTRGTFANIRIRNLLAPGTEGGVTRHLPDGEQMTHLRRGDEVQGRGRAAGRAGRRGVRHGLQPRLGRQGHVPARRASGDRRELRAHPPQQPGEMGVLPLEFDPGVTWQSLGLTGDEMFDIPDLDDDLQAAAEADRRGEARGPRSRRSEPIRSR